MILALWEVGKRGRGGREEREGVHYALVISSDVCTLLLGLKIASPCSILLRALVASSHDAFMKDGCTITRWMYSRSNKNNSMSYMYINTNHHSKITLSHSQNTMSHSQTTCHSNM